MAGDPVTLSSTGPIVHGFSEIDMLKACRSFPASNELKTDDVLIRSWMT